MAAGHPDRQAVTRPVTHRLGNGALSVAEQDVKSIA